MEFSKITRWALLFIAVGVGAQTTTSDDALAHARKVYSEDGPKAALPEFEAVLSQYRAHSNQRGEAITLGLIGNCYKKMGDPKRALEFLEKALVMKRDLHDTLEEGRTLSHIGLVYWETAEYPKAVEAFNSAIEIGRKQHDAKLEAGALNNLALVYDEQGEYQKSLAQYQQALILHRQTGYEPGQSDTLGNIGGVYLMLGQAIEASRYYSDALKIDERLLMKPAISQDIGNLALCDLQLGNLEQAIDEFERAAKLASDAGLRKESADWQKGKSGALLQLGRFDDARAALDEATHTYLSGGLQRELSEALNDSGNLYLNLGDRLTARKQFRQAGVVAARIGNERGVVASKLMLSDLDWRTKAYDTALRQSKEALDGAKKLNDVYGEISALLLEGTILRDTGQRKAAQQINDSALQKARDAHLRLLEAESLQKGGELFRLDRSYVEAINRFSESAKLSSESGDVDLEWRAMYGQGRAFESLGKLDEAVTAYRSAVDRIESVRAQIRPRRLRSGYLQDKQDVYSALVRLLIRLNRPSEGLEFSERLREQAFLHQVFPTLNRSTRVITVLRNRIEHLQDLLERENRRPISEQRSAATSNFSEELRQAERDYQSLSDDAASRGMPDDHQRSVAEIENRIGNRSAVIEFLLTENGIAEFVIRTKSVHALFVPIRRVAVTSKVELVRDLLQNKDSDDWKAPAESLHSLLIAPLERRGWLKGAETLSIVPNDVLNYVPFAALPSREGFLVERYVIGYLPTAALKPYPIAGRSRSAILALAPAVSHLKFSGDEARNVAETGSSPESKVLIGRAATETAFKRLGPHFQVIHLATHGYFNRMNPSFSGLQLERDSENDGRLEVHEILDVRLKADLVTLSACDTGLGAGYFDEMPAGDDFVGLTRAFLEAGSSSVMATLWKVDDRSTAELMERTYRGMRSNSKSSSLAAAQREAIHSSQYRHPFFWAPFVLIEGNTRISMESAEKH